jgi:phenylacetate-coenzyme A ligase PaaK-like adenylate-forming protein
MPSYESLRTRHQQDEARLRDEHFQRLTWTSERLRAERQTRLRALVRLAKTRSPWHRERLAYIDPETVTEADLPSIPVMTKDDMMSNLEGIWADPRLSRDLVERHLDSLEGDSYLLDELHVVESGGSSGTRGVFVYDWEGWLLCWLTFYRTRMRHQLDLGLGPRPVRASVAAGKATHLSYALSGTFGASIGTATIPVTLPMSEIVMRLNDLQPDIVFAYPSILCALAHEVSAGALTIKPRVLHPMGEPFLPEMRSEIERAWSCPILSNYGTSEGVSASSCGHGPGLHLNEDLVIFELVDADGRQVPPGVRASKMYITNLYNTVQPLIRYELTDEATVIDSPCVCGSSMRRIADVEGRSDDLFVYEGGLVVHPLVFRSLLAHEREVVEYQVTQTQRGAAIALRAQGAVDAPSLATALEAELLRLGLQRPNVTIEVVDGLDRLATGKFKRFVPLN